MTGIEMKPKYRFSLGGLLCTAFGLWLCFNCLLYILGSVWRIACAIEAMGGFDFNYLLTTGVTVIEGTVIQAIAALSILVFGVMLLFKVHSKALIFLPIIRLCLCLYSLGGVVIKFFGGIIIGFLDGQSILGIICYSFSQNIISTLIETVIWVLVLALILANCSKKREPYTKGRIGFVAWLLPVLIIAAFVVSVIEFGVTTLLMNYIYAQFFGTAVVYSSYFSPMSYLLIWPEYFMQWGVPANLIKIIDVETWIIPTVVAALGAFFSALWIARPYEKKK